MCCFSPVTPFGLLARLFPPRVHVAGTRIFARALPDGRQALVYSMQLSVAGEVAMLLPVPVQPGLGDAALEFTSLEGHASFFDDLAGLFLSSMPAQPKRRAPLRLSLRPRLVVHTVGAFEASYVPTVGDFDRLDPRFRLPEAVWGALSDHAAAGFAVFRLTPGRRQQIHPMAFRFTPRDPSRLFFPTVHVHDGRVHETARFDHELYFQRPAALDPDPAPRDLVLDGLHERSVLVPTADHHGLVEPGVPVWRRALRGRLPNRDTWIDPELGLAGG